jgi:hypothetical protein
LALGVFELAGGNEEDAVVEGARKPYFPEQILDKAGVSDKDVDHIERTANGVAVRLGHRDGCASYAIWKDQPVPIAAGMA